MQSEEEIKKHAENLRLSLVYLAETAYKLAHYYEEYIQAMESHRVEELHDYQGMPGTYGPVPALLSDLTCVSKEYTRFISR